MVDHLMRTETPRIQQGPAKGTSWNQRLFSEVDRYWVTERSQKLRDGKLLEMPDKNPTLLPGRGGTRIHAPPTGRGLIVTASSAIASTILQAYYRVPMLWVVKLISMLVDAGCQHRTLAPIRNMLVGHML